NHPDLRAHGWWHWRGARRRDAAVNPIGERVLARCQARGSEESEVYISRGTEFTVRVYKGQIESLVSAESRGIGVRTFLEHPVGFLYTSDTQPPPLPAL